MSYTAQNIKRYNRTIANVGDCTYTYGTAYRTKRLLVSYESATELLGFIEDLMDQVAEFEGTKIVTKKQQ